MFNSNFFNSDPYSFNKSYKFEFEKKINKLTKWHVSKCKDYKKIVSMIGYKIHKKSKISEVPFIPTRLFKTNELLSVKKKQIVKTLLSSGTSETGFSKIYLDSYNSVNQIKALKKIMESIIGKERIPMIIVDKDPRNLSNKEFNAKTAAILGFSYFGKNHFFLLNKDNKIDYAGLKKFLNKYSNQNFLIFGFTSYIFEYLIKRFLFKENKINFNNGILLHGGGWKRLEKMKISTHEFKKSLRKKFNIKNIINYYGTVEQTGSIFLECKKCGGFKTSIYSDVIIRDREFKEQKINNSGIIQLISVLPTSYPGHSILTEDTGKIIHDGDCQDDFEGKCFIVSGRLEKAEIRGCSDVGNI